MAEAEKKYLSATAVCARYDNKTKMTLYRWCKDPELNFPKPVKIRGQNYWLVSELNAYDSSMEGARA
ncbi:helix-turn-helix transcriptional regulator [Agrobacterium rosae]|uniref:DNA-binding protein n=1 Tax=Agrobacterium rosae TaxID=1972867 RepID=A0AAW9FCJ5_9HYPH|nr:hypothetical protein [Agrobacterium rosae]MDX8301312.1 hypothetical protein [Agrobacterium rosae]